MILNDRQIKALVAKHDMINPFIPNQVREVIDDDDEFGTSPRKIISKGLSSFGYDISLANLFKAYSSPYSVHQQYDKWDIIVDPLNFDENVLETFSSDSETGYVVMPPHGYFLSHSNEYIKMPPNTNALCLTKSSYARAGVLCNTTPIEAAWEGIITLEIANLTDRPVKLYVNQGICQLQFFEGLIPDVSYADRRGKYQHQTGITLPRG